MTVWFWIRGGQGGGGKAQRGEEKGWGGQEGKIEREMLIGKKSSKRGRDQRKVRYN